MVKIILADGQTLNAHFLMKHLGLQEIISMFAIICQKMSEMSNSFQQPNSLWLACVQVRLYNLLLHV